MKWYPWMEFIVEHGIWVVVACMAWMFWEVSR